MTEEAVRAKPFVKWVGGKRGIIKELIHRLPKKINNYYEPFVGGGALFFMLFDKVKFSYLSDMNIDLVVAYNAIKKDTDKIIKILEKHKEKHGKDYYYQLRSKQ